MEIKVRTQEGKILAFRPGKPYASPEEMREEFQRIHKDSIEKNRWDILP